MIYVAGHRGMVGAALVRALCRRGVEPLTVDRTELDLTQQAPVLNWFERNRPNEVYLAAARVGGIRANATYPAEFISQNLAIETNVIDGAHRVGAKLMFLGSVCIYPKLAAEPVAEDALLTGSLEPTNQWYAVAKIAGVKMCQAYREQYGNKFLSVMPCNLYGPGDNYHPLNSHVIPALIRRYHEAKASGASSVTNWGSGLARREFLFVDDLAEACIFLMAQKEAPEITNIGSGQDHSIAEIAGMIAGVVGYGGETIWDTSKPDGTPRRLLNCGKLFDLGWRPTIPLRIGLERAYAWFRLGIL